MEGAMGRTLVIQGCQSKGLLSFGGRQSTFLAGFHWFLAGVLLVSVPTEQSIAGEIISGRSTMMGTFIEIKVVAEGGRTAEAPRAIELAMRQMKAFVELVSSWDANSDTSRINASAGKVPVKVDATLMKVLLGAQQVSQVSAGAFDITFSPVGRLWKLRRDDPVIPSDDAIAEALAVVNHKDLVLDRQKGTAFLRRKGMRIDLGGIAKGAAVDVGARSLRTSGFENALIDAGGDLYAMGAKPAGPWVVGITDPRNPDGPVIGRHPVRDRAVTTSGDYEKMVEIAGKRYHHIIDPRTGWPADKCISATVIAPDAQRADAFSTAFFVLGPKAGIALCEKIDDVEAVLIDTDFNVTYSSGFPKVIERGKPK
jgi:thiamine biosynthesis lipoprotein